MARPKVVSRQVVGPDNNLLLAVALLDPFPLMFEPGGLDLTKPAHRQAVEARGYWVIADVPQPGGDSVLTRLGRIEPDPKWVDNPHQPWRATSGEHVSHHHDVGEATWMIARCWIDDRKPKED